LIESVASFGKAYSAELNLGIVAKIDLSEVRKPFFRAAIITLIFAAILIGLGARIFIKVTNPILMNLHKTVKNLQNTLKEVKTLRGMLPICSFCKKIRSDAGLESAAGGAAF
jgi:hypothetical protein